MKEVCVHLGLKVVCYVTGQDAPRLPPPNSRPPLLRRPKKENGRTRESCRLYLYLGHYHQSCLGRCRQYCLNLSRRLDFSSKTGQDSACVENAMAHREWNKMR